MVYLHQDCPKWLSAFAILIMSLTVHRPAIGELTGIDVSTDAVSKQQLECLKQHGYGDIFATRLSLDGVEDPNAAQNLHYAAIMGFKQLDLYFYPTMAHDPFDQVEEVLLGLVKTHPALCRNISTLWIGVEMDNQWRARLSKNVEESDRWRSIDGCRNFTVGILTTFEQWTAVTGNSGLVVTTVEDEDQRALPLWYGNHGDDAGSDDFVQLGGWSSAKRKTVSVQRDLCDMEIVRIVSEA